MDTSTAMAIGPSGLRALSRKSMLIIFVLFLLLLSGLLFSLKGPRVLKFAWGFNSQKK